MDCFSILCIKSCILFNRIVLIRITIYIKPANKHHTLWTHWLFIIRIRILFHIYSNCILTLLKMTISSIKSHFKQFYIFRMKNSVFIIWCITWFMSIITIPSHKFIASWYNWIHTIYFFTCSRFRYICSITIFKVPYTCIKSNIDCFSILCIKSCILFNSSFLIRITIYIKPTNKHHTLWTYWFFIRRIRILIHIYCNCIFTILKMTISSIKSYFAKFYIFCIIRCILCK